MIKRKIHDAEAQISQLEMQAEGWKREAARLKAENEKLRAALARIANTVNVEDSPYHRVLAAVSELMLTVKRDVRAALKEGET